MPTNDVAAWTDLRARFRFLEAIAPLGRTEQRRNADQEEKEAAMLDVRLSQQ